METYSKYNVLVIIVAALGSLYSGFAFSVVVATLGQPSFYSSLKLESDPTASGYSHTATIIGAITGVFYGGAALGTFLSGWAGDRFGRVPGIRLAAMIGTVGAILQTGAVNIGMYLLARVLTGFATGHLVAALGTYFSEVAPPHSRGLMGGAHGSFINLGFCVSAWTGFGCYHVKGSFGWRLPNAVLVFLGLCLIGGTFFIPESPRWLVAGSQHEKALSILCKLHHDASDPEDHFAHRELGLIKKQQDVDHAAILADGRWQLFTKKTYRRRLILCIMLLAGGQNVGILVINSYNTLLYESLGLTTPQALIVGASFNTMGTLSNMLGAVLSDRLGRRKILVSGFALNVSMFIVATGLIARYSETSSTSFAAAAVAFLFLYGFFYACCIDVNQYTYASEIFPSHLRSQGASLGFAAFFLVDTLWIALEPTAVGAIGWKYFLIFAILGTMHTIYLYFKLPEVTGLALEEIDALFGKEVVGHIEDESLEVESLEAKDGTAVFEAEKTLSA